MKKYIRLNFQDREEISRGIWAGESFHPHGIKNSWVVEWGGYSRPVYGGKGVYKELDKRLILEKPKYFSKRLILELCENVHLHYRNLRLEFSNNEFCDMYRCFKNGFKKFQEYILDNAEIKEIKLSQIDPYDAGHKEKNDYFDCGEEQSDHIEGINLVKELIQKGRKIRPIAIVWNKERQIYIRMDGFKRYWAYKELKLKSISCYILKEYIAGIQEGMSEYID